MPVLVRPQSVYTTLAFYEAIPALRITCRPELSLRCAYLRRSRNAIAGLDAETLRWGF